MGILCNKQLKQHSSTEVGRGGMPALALGVCVSTESRAENREVYL